MREKKDFDIEKFLVGYLVAVGIPVALFGFSVFFGGLPILSEKIVVFLSVVLFIYFLQKQWKNYSTVFAISISVIASWTVFAIFFLFTFPVWFMTGIISLFYGLSTGLFKKANRPKNIKRLKIARIVSISLFAVSLAATFWVYSYGFNPIPCQYTYEELPIPSELVGIKIVVEQDVYLAKGLTPEVCKWSGPIIENEIISNRTIENNTVGKEYYEKQGRTIAPFEKGAEFDLVKIWAQTSHGIITIDGGGGPLYDLVLKDKYGMIYKISTTALDDDVVAYYKNGVKQGYLTWSLFDDYFPRF